MARLNPVSVLSVALVLLMGVVFCTHLEGAWVWDDVYLIEHNDSLLQGWSGLARVLTHDLWGGAGHASSDLYHPLPLALAWFLSAFGGKSVVVLRFVNVLIHAANGLLFAAWLRRRGLAGWGTTWATLLFCVHPLVTEPVMWITGSHDLLGTFSSLVALVAWPRRGERRILLRVGLASVATMGAALCKEPYFVLPLLLALALLFERPLESGAPRMLWLLGPGVGLGIVWSIRLALGIRTASDQLSVSFWTHCVNYASILCHYAKHVVTFSNAPTTESFRSVGEVAAGTALGAVVMITGALFAWWRRGTLAAPYGAEALVGWGWALIGFAPHVLSTPIIGMFGNRYAYFPMMGAATMLLALISSLSERYARTPWRKLHPALPAAVTIVALFTAAEARNWKSELSLFGADVQRIPNDAHTLYHYGHAVVQKDGCAAALPFFEAASQRDPGYGRPWHNIAGCLVRLGRYDEALPAARIAWRLQPYDGGSAFNLAVAEAATGHRGEAVRLLEMALSLAPHHAAARRLMGELAYPGPSLATTPSADVSASP